MAMIIKMSEWWGLLETTWAKAATRTAREKITIKALVGANSDMAINGFNNKQDMTMMADAVMAIRLVGADGKVKNIPPRAAIRKNKPPPAMIMPGMRA